MIIGFKLKFHLLQRKKGMKFTVPLDAFSTTWCTETGST
jgi:hypothetical protein